MEHVGKKLVNRQLVYATVSCGRADAQVYINDKTHPSKQLTRGRRTDPRWNKAAYNNWFHFKTVVTYSRQLA
jgi:hypothetical protein